MAENNIFYKYICKDISVQSDSQIEVAVSIQKVVLLKKNQIGTVVCDWIHSLARSMVVKASAIFWSAA